jgi:hypothetical protein
VFFVPEERFEEAAVHLIADRRVYRRLDWRLSDVFDLTGLAPAIENELLRQSE